MYSPKIIAANAALVESTTSVKLKEYSPAEVDEWLARMKNLTEPVGKEKWKWNRNPTQAEQEFIINERMMTKLSFTYWATRYGFIRNEKGGDERIKFRESQELMLRHISEMQEAGLPIFIINLKARQIYSSTLSELILTHKVTTTSGITSLLAADIPKQSEFLFNMMQRIFDHLPFYLQPHRKYEVKGVQMFFDQLDSNILVDSGNKKDSGVGQGKALHCGHLSELATWNDPDTVTADLIPAILSASSIDSFWIFESTAMGKVSHWRDWWIAAKKNKFFGFRPVFIPFYILKEKYAMDPPLGWGPSTRAIALGASLKATKGVELTRKQLYWWDNTYESYKEQNKLNEFFAEYASDDEEAFQLTGRSIFSIETVQDLRRKAMLKPFCPYQIEERSAIA